MKVHLCKMVRRKRDFGVCARCLWMNWAGQDRVWPLASTRTSVICLSDCKACRSDYLNPSVKNSIRINVTLRRVRVTVFIVEKQ